MTSQTSSVRYGDKMTCKHVKQYDEQHAEVHCTKCGLVLKENCIDFVYSPEFESDRKISRHFERPFLSFCGTNEADRMITTCLSRRGRSKLKHLGILY